MKIAVRVKRDKEFSDPYTLIVDIMDVEDDLINIEDRINDACHDAVSDHLGEDPKWIRVEGKVEILEI